MLLALRDRKDGERGKKAEEDGGEEGEKNPKTQNSEHVDIYTWIYI